MDNGQGHPERRAVPRIKKVVVVQYRVKDLPQAGVDISQTRDLSEKGIFFTISNPLAAGTILNLKLKLPTVEKTIELEGRVVSCEGVRKNIIYGIGVEFINLGEEQKKVLKDFVQLFKKS